MYVMAKNYANINGLEDMFRLSSPIAIQLKPL